MSAACVKNRWLYVRASTDYPINIIVGSTHPRTLSSKDILCYFSSDVIATSGVNIGEDDQPSEELLIVEEELNDIDIDDNLLLRGFT